MKFLIATVVSLFCTYTFAGHEEISFLLPRLPENLGCTDVIGGANQVNQRHNSNGYGHGISQTGGSIDLQFSDHEIAQ